jgi:hypothetical protein
MTAEGTVGSACEVRSRPEGPGDVTSLHVTRQHIQHEPWCTDHAVDEDGPGSGCGRSVEVAGVQIHLAEMGGTVALTLHSDGQNVLTATQVRRIAAELVDASRILQSAQQP